MSISPLEARQVSQQGDLNRSVDPGLVERAEGLGRAAVMDKVLGPHLDNMLRPMYETGISEKDKKLPSLQGEFPLRTLEQFFLRLRFTLQDRFRSTVSSSEEYRQLLELNRHRQDLLFYANDPSQNISEAIGTSIAAPLTLASQIFGLEKPEKERPYPVRDVDGLAEIMERESFEKKTLLRLTRGPNEFVGQGSDTFTEHGLFWFYNFILGRDRLPAHKAFKLEHGSVVGLSDAYTLAAEQRRKTLRSGDSSSKRHQGNDSSGCPVRHGVGDAEGKPQDSLVVTGNKFVIAALRHAEQLPLKKR